MTGAPGTGIEVMREVGRVTGSAPGATLIVVAGLHGNEPAGIEGARRVLAHFEQGTLKGELVVLAGNVAGLRQGVRHHERDLNRGWTDAHMARIDALAVRTHEDAEQHELWSSIEGARARARGPVFLADLHTSSAAGVPFVLYRETPEQHDFVRVFPIPVINGIVEKVEGVLSEFCCARGIVAFSVEGGQHEAPESRDALEAILWLALQRAGMAFVGAEVERANRLLDGMRAGLPRVVDVRSRHAITAEDAFVMEPGFRNIDRVQRGQLLARDRRGEVRAPEDGVVVLPLYQKLGNDGFFWGSERA
ncbi:MAG: succinylglutamate desuccinylase/aspartoacylase family protein [Deltaproteobacteria bacterium]|nr:succinylglutamate desuccinylase/aspartoacylase family protein [Deltaproteobacteria bacterium]